MSASRALSVLPRRNTLIPKKNAAIAAPRQSAPTERSVTSTLDERVKSGLFKGVQKRDLLLSLSLAAGGIFHHLVCKGKNCGCQVSVRIVESEDPAFTKDMFVDQFMGDFQGMLDGILDGLDGLNEPSDRK